MCVLEEPFARDIISLFDVKSLPLNVNWIAAKKRRAAAKNKLSGEPWGRIWPGWV